MKQLLTRLAREEGGQDLIEYALLCAILAVGCITAILGLAQIREFFARAGLALNNAL